MADFMTNYGILIAGILIFIGILAILIVFPIMHLIANPEKLPEKLKKGGVVLVTILALYILSYSLASDELTEHFLKFNVTAKASKQVGTGLMMFYILASGTVISVLYTEVTKMLNK